MARIKVAIVGVGNCASALIQGLEYYKDGSKTAGLMHPTIGDYKVSDMLPVACFDVDKRKVGKDLSEAIFCEPNCAERFADVPHLGVKVLQGPPMDGVDAHLAQKVKVSDQEQVNVGKVLRETKAEVVLNFLPTGGVEAAKFYATQAMEVAKVGYVNGMPALIANDAKYAQMAEDNSVPLIGDDVKSQVGGTAQARALLTLFMHKGVRIKNTYQLNIGGNTDFFNMLDRADTKIATKIGAMDKLVPYETHMWGGPAGYIDFLNDNKVAYTFLEGEGFGGRPVVMRTELRVSDSPNFAGVMVDAVRYCKLASDRGIGGVLTSASAWLMKMGPEQLSDEEARQRLEEFIEGKRER